MKTVLLATVAGLALLAGCSGTGSTTAKAPEGVGGYFLVSVNGLNVPAVTVQNETVKQEILTGNFTSSSEGTFTETRTGRITLSGGTPSTIQSTQSGTWTKSGSQFLFVTGTVTAPITFVGTFSGGVLTYTASGTTFKYQLALPD